MVFKKGNIAHNKLKLVGKKFGRLTVVKEAGNRGEQTLWTCICDCGKEIVTIGWYLTSGRKQSCGCLQRETTSKSNSKDLLGKTFGRLTVLERNGINKWGSILWKCKCFCGTILNVSSSSLIGGTKSCGCYAAERAGECNTKNLLGIKFGRLLVLEKDENTTKSGNVKWKCICDCGQERSIVGSALINGTTKSCGCLKRDLMSKMASNNSGENSPAWKGGASFGKYCTKWTPELRNRIRAFFDYRCIMCGKSTEENGRQLCCHHVEYNKEACCDGQEVHFAALCMRCHNKTNLNREKWENIFHIIINEIYNNRSYYTKDEYNKFLSDNNETGNNI